MSPQSLRDIFGAHYCTDVDVLFATPEGNCPKPHSITAKVCLLARSAGLKGISLHSLRHTHSSVLLGLGVPLPVVSKHLGHTTPAVTPRFTATLSHAMKSRLLPCGTRACGRRPARRLRSEAELQAAAPLVHQPTLTTVRGLP